MPSRWGQKRGVVYDCKLLVTGDTGFLAHHVIPELDNAYPSWEIIKPQGKKFFDLTHPIATDRLFDSIDRDSMLSGKVRVVVNLAALSGGIKDNMEKQASYWYQNTMINANVIEACTKNRVAKLVQFMGGCSYPNKVGKLTAFTEDELWEGLPVASSVGYSAAKKMNVISAFAYKEQFGLDTTVLIPTNPIGEWDNFSEQHAHVAPALIQRFIEARDEGYGTVTVWGSGKPVRDFIYAGDIAKVVPFFIDHSADVGPYNISTGKGTTIAELAEMILKATKYKGKLHFDSGKPDGQAHKVLDNSKLMKFLNDNNLTWDLTPIDEAIQRTVDWFERRVWDRTRHVHRLGGPS